VIKRLEEEEKGAKASLGLKRNKKKKRERLLIG
jgi:hypothetical protein